MDGRGMPRNRPEAWQNYRRACDGEVGQACYNFAQVPDILCVLIICGV